MARGHIPSLIKRFLLRLIASEDNSSCGGELAAFTYTQRGNA